MHDTVWGEKKQTLVDSNEIKGMKQILEERGINTATLKGPDMRLVLSCHEDFWTEKTIIERHFLDQHHHVHFILKFELNPIECRQRSTHVPI